MVAKKRKSKRQTLQKKYKIQRRVKDHHKKLKQGRTVGSVKKKSVDNFVPNLWPYKEDVLKEIQAAKDRMEVMKQRQKEKRHEELAKRRAKSNSAMEVVDTNETTKSNTINIRPFEAVEQTENDQDIKQPNLGQNSRRAYLKELRKTVESADVLLMVLDARDPLGTKSSAVEEMILSDHRKKLVYVLNKADLVPKEVLGGWLSYLRKIHPTIPFKCNTQNQKGNLGRVSGKIAQQNESSLQTSQAVGADELLSLLKNYARIGDSKSLITVGIVGFPNVGKSSLINSLMRTRAVGVSSVPGFTKSAQEVHLDKNIRLMDSPGIVFADGDSTATALRNCVNVEEMEDVITPIQAILDRCPQQYLMQLYTIPKFKNKDAMSFLALVAKATGRLKKGGIPNIDSAARSIIHDWNTGKIKYYCKPPRLVNSVENESAIVSELGKDFNALAENDIRVLDAIEAMRGAEESTMFVGVENVGEDMEVSLNDDEPVKSVKKTKKEKTVTMDIDEVPELVPASEAASKAKKTKKAATRENYDFDVDFQYSK